MNQPSASMSHNSLKGDDLVTASLEALQNNEHRNLLNAVDMLRRQGLSGILQLPQLVVFGDQSSGKSSVLEAITEIPFPRNENLCTRFATEIILRRSMTSTISTRITPDKNRPEHEQEKLKEFAVTIIDFTQLPDVVGEATKAMGLEEIGMTQKAFARDVLTVEICGPARPQLTLVDLPGVIHSANRAQSEDDVKLITDLVLEYMKNPRTIILAVISAKNDYANQVVLKYSREIDPDGRRTLGLITKPDTLLEGSANQQSWLDLAQNRDIYFELGWHMVRNRSELETTKSFAQRNILENQFFSTGAYNDLPVSCKGIETLRNRLSMLLHDHLKRELPQLKDELTEKLLSTSKELAQLGVKRSTPLEQRLFLTDLAQKVNDMLKSAVRGQYEHAFFGAIDMEAEVSSSKNVRRFRAVIQHLNMEFSNRMHLQGHKYQIPKDNMTVGTGNLEQRQITSPPPDDHADDARPRKKRKISSDSPGPIEMTRDQAIDWVCKTLVRSRGQELPGTFNPLIVSQLFWEQSLPWSSLAHDHIEHVSSLCKNFVDIVLSELVPADIKTRLATHCIDGALEESLRLAKEELKKIIKDKCRHPSTYNHYYTSKIMDHRKSTMNGMFESAVEGQQKHIFSHEYREKTFIDYDVLSSKISKGIEQEMDRFGANEALESEIAYYADELKYFINCVAKQVIERHLVDPLNDVVLSPKTIAGMTEKQVTALVSEPRGVSRHRERLETRKDMLEKGMKVFKEALGGLS